MPILLGFATSDVSRIFIELGAAIVGLAILGRLASRWGFSAIPLYLLAGLSRCSDRSWRGSSRRGRLSRTEPARFGAPRPFPLTARRDIIFMVAVESALNRSSPGGPPMTPT